MYLSQTYLISSRCSVRKRIDLEISKLSQRFSSLHCWFWTDMWIRGFRQVNNKVAENLHHRRHAQPPRRQERFQGSYTGHARAKCTQVIIGRGWEEDELSLYLRYSCKASISWAKDLVWFDVFGFSSKCKVQHDSLILSGSFKFLWSERRMGVVVTKWAWSRLR